MDINKTEELKRKLRVEILKFEHHIVEIKRIIQELRALVITDDKESPERAQD